MKKKKLTSRTIILTLSRSRNIAARRGRTTGFGAAVPCWVLSLLGAIPSSPPPPRVQRLVLDGVDSEEFFWTVRLHGSPAMAQTALPTCALARALGYNPLSDGCSWMELGYTTRVRIAPSWHYSRYPRESISPWWTSPVFPRGFSYPSRGETFSYRPLSGPRGGSPRVEMARSCLDTALSQRPRTPTPHTFFPP